MDPDQGPGGKINVDPDPQPWWTVEYSMYYDRTRSRETVHRDPRNRIFSGF